MAVTEDSRHYLLSHLYLYATAAYNLGCVYQSRKQTELANKYLEIGIEERKQYARHSPNPNDEGHVAWALVGKASGEIGNGLFKDAKQHLEEAEEIYDRIVKLNPDDHSWALGRLYANYGDFHRKLNEYEEAEKEYAKAMSMFKEYIDVWPVDYLTYIKYTFGSLLNWTLPAIETLAKLHKLNDIKILLDDISPYYLKTPLKDTELKEESATKMSRISNYLIRLGLFKEAEEMFIQALEIRQQLAKNKPNVYEPYVAQTLGSLSFNAIFMKKYSEAERLSREGLAVDSTQQFIYTNLAAALLFQGKYTEAENIYRQYKDELKEGFLDDFDRFKAVGVIPKEREEDVEKIKRILDE